MEGFERFWFEVLSTGNLTGQINKINLTQDFEQFSVDWVGPEFVGSDWLKTKYLEFDKNSQRFQTVQIKFIREQLRKLCPSAKESRVLQPEKCEKGVRHPRGFALPALAFARQEFCTAIGAEIDWWDD